jgi:hypothetical protein
MSRCDSWVCINVEVSDKVFQKAVESADSIQLAMELGRLDLISTFLGGVAILFVLSAIPAYGLVQRKAAKVARQEVRKIRDEAMASAEKAAIEKIQDVLPELVSEYMELVKNSVDGNMADEIAEAQENDGRN